ncbi:M48 family metallopeptidase [Pseudochelatococcus sp. B33]
MAAFGLYTHIRANRIRSALLIGGLFLLLYVLVFAGALAGEALAQDAPFDVLVQRALAALVPAIPIATLAALVWIVIAYLFNRAIIGAVAGAREVTRQDAPELYALLENLCISRGLRTPRLAIIDTDALNAFASGLNESQYTVTVTRGLLAALDRNELEAVLAHELTHIRNKDVQLMVTAMIIAGVISFVGEMIFRWLRFAPLRGSRSRGGDRNSGGGAAIALVVAVVIALVAVALSVVIRFALSRSREYLADAGAVELTKNPDAMIGALMKISGRSDLPALPSSLMEMCVDNPRHGFQSLFATHPPIESRIEALVRHGGGVYPAPAAELPPTPPDHTDPSSGGPPRRGPWGLRRGPWG